MKNLISLLLASVLVLSCGSDDKRKSQFSPLTTQERSSFGQFVTAAENSVQAPAEIHEKKTGKIASLQNNTTPDPARIQMKEQLEKAECEIKAELSEGRTSGQMPTFKPGDGHYYLTVSGKTCPATMDTQFKYSYTATAINATFSAKYSIQNEEYKKLNDVIAFDLTGAFNASATENSYDGSGSVTGTVDSTQHGQVKVEMTTKMKGDKDKGESLTIITFKFPTYTAEVRMILEGPHGQQKSETFLNGEKLETQQVQAIKRLMGLL